MHNLSEIKAKLRINTIFALLCMLALAIPTVAMAFAAPVAGDFGFAVYDFIMTNMIGGALGILLTCLCCGMGVYACVNRQMGGVPVGIGFFALAAAIFNIESLATSIGAMV